eukprot:1003927-Prorocentrum_minimum.AAC.1
MQRRAGAPHVRVGYCKPTSGWFTVLFAAQICKEVSRASVPGRAGERVYNRRTNDTKSAHKETDDYIGRVKENGGNTNKAKRQQCTPNKPTSVFGKGDSLVS